MRFVVDTNIIFSAIIKDSTTRRILLHPMFEFYIPEFVFIEMEKHSDEIIEKSGLTKEEYHLMVDTIISRITVVPKSDFEDYLPKSEQIMEKIDEDDTSFLAVAMYLGTDIWSDDEDFQKQSAVNVWKTKDMVKLLSK
jgi:predicted nucleic acid-binding protein